MKCEGSSTFSSTAQWKQFISAQVGKQIEFLGNGVLVFNLAHKYGHNHVKSTSMKPQLL